MKERFDPLNGSIAHVLECLGEGWSMLIIREAFFGIRRFEDFQSHLGIARNILTARLKKLVANGILERVPIKEGAKLVTGITDILEELNIAEIAPKKQLNKKS